MIVSHKYRFIFIKTQKTAGTSVEIALSKYCGESDIITPISPRDEKTRREMGYCTAQNYLIPFSRYTQLDWFNLAYNRRRLAFYNHAPASLVLQYINADIWNTYYKFCFERNPWDKAVSFYYWQTRKKSSESISDFIMSGGVNAIGGFDLYTIRGEIVVDRVFRFENLNEEIKAIAKIIGLPEVPELPKAKGDIRKGGQHYRELLGTQERDKIAKVFAREIAYFGYEW